MLILCLKFLMSELGIQLIISSFVYSEELNCVNYSILL